MDLRKIKKLIELLQSSGVAEIEITEGKESVRIRTSSIDAQAGNAILSPQAALETAPLPRSTGATNEVLAEAAKEQITITSPMVGTVYLAPKPDAKPFLEVGQVIKAGNVVCLIIAMKMFHKIEADKPGKIVSILVENGESVEYGQPLFMLE